MHSLGLENVAKKMLSLKKGQKNCPNFLAGQKTDFGHFLDFQIEKSQRCPQVIDFFFGRHVFRGSKEPRKNSRSYPLKVFLGVDFLITALDQTKKYKRKNSYLKLESTEKMESLRQKYLNHAMNYNPPTWRPPVTAGSKSTQGSTTTRRTTTRTSPQPRPTSALTTRRKPVQWTRYNWTNSPTTVTTTTRLRTTKRTTKPTTTTRIDENYDDFYGDSSGAPATPSGQSFCHLIF